MVASISGVQLVLPIEVHVSAESTELSSVVISCLDIDTVLDGIDADSVDIRVNIDEISEVCDREQSMTSVVADEFALMFGNFCGDTIDQNRIDASLEHHFNFVLVNIQDDVLVTLVVVLGKEGEHFVWAAILGNDCVALGVRNRVDFVVKVRTLFFCMSQYRW